MFSSPHAGGGFSRSGSCRRAVLGPFFFFKISRLIVLNALVTSILRIPQVGSRIISPPFRYISILFTQCFYFALEIFVVKIFFILCFIINYKTTAVEYSVCYKSSSFFYYIKCTFSVKSTRSDILSLHLFIGESSNKLY